MTLRARFWCSPPTVTPMCQWVVERSSLAFEGHGLAGVLTDGRLRDFDELAPYDFASYCAGEATRWGRGEVTPFQANVPSS